MLNSKERVLQQKWDKSEVGIMVEVQVLRGSFKCEEEKKRSVLLMVK